MPLSPVEFDQFCELLEDGPRTEREAQAFLVHAAVFLMRTTPVRIRQVREEDRSYFGRTDFIVVADLRTDTGQIENFASIWELKAPQSFLMERDDNDNRYRPTKDLVKAENQLIHYIYDARGSAAFRERYDIRFTSNIKIGGIIIGRDDRIVDSDDERVISTAEQSLRIRQNALYEPALFRVLTWDRIRDHLKPD
jgi:hypothetical protein